MFANTMKMQILEDEIQQLSASLEAKKDELRRLRESNDRSATVNGNVLTNSEIGRFSRQIILPEIGVNGQIKLRNTNILIVGAGGLGKQYFFGYLMKEILASKLYSMEIG